MSNLFSIFDPSTMGGLSLNWFSSFLIFLALPSTFWVMPSQMLVFFNMCTMYLFKEMKMVMKSFSLPSLTYLMVSLFLFIVLNNLFGLIPYIFTSTSHLIFASSLAFPLWVGHTNFANIIQPKQTLAHLVPLGTPYALAPFMVLIEIVSQNIRPYTLAIRLSANMIAGHLLLTLLSSQEIKMFSGMFILLISCLVLMMMLELAVAIIQAYVFSVLSSLYIDEVNSLKISK